MVTCRWCGASLNDATQLSEHEAIHKLLDGLGGYLTHEPERQLDENNDGQRSSETHEPIIQLNNDSLVTNERDLTPKNTFQCDQCTKSFRYKQSLNQHVIAAHTNQTFDCSKCGKVFKYDKHRLLHEKSCQGSGEHVCCQCGKRCFTSQGLKKHTVWHEKKGKETSSFSNATTTDRASIRSSNKRSQFCCRQCTECFDSKKDLIEHNMSHHSQTGSSRQSNATLQQYHCRRCTECFNNRRDLYLHGVRQHYQTGGALQQRPWDDDSAPWNRNDQQDRLRQVYEANEPLILEPHRLGPIHSVYNFPLDNNVNVNQLMRYADDIFNREQRAFRLNLVFGVILQNRETGEYRYFVPYNNNGIFERPLYVSRRGDLGQLRLRLQQRDILDEILRHRPDTKWIPVLVTNVLFTVYSTVYPLGTGEVPEFLLRKESIYPLIKCRLTGKRYKDHLCAFRCLALHRGHDIRNVDGPAKEFHRKWQTNANTCQDGITFEDFPDFEKFFNVNLEDYSLQEDGFAQSIYKCRGLQETTMYLNMYENHLSYIRDFAMYGQKYQCKTCDRHFDRINNLHRHQKICANKTKYVYPGGFYQSRESVFEELDRYGILVPEDQRLFPWFACFDFEAML